MADDDDGCRDEDDGCGCLTLTLVAGVIAAAGILLHDCSKRNEINGLNQKLNSLSQEVKDLKEKIPITEIKDGRTNQFYQIGEQKAYIKINGRPADSYTR